MIKIATSAIAETCYKGNTTGVILHELPYSIVIGNSFIEKDTLSIVPFETQHYGALGNSKADSTSPNYPLMALEETDVGWCLDISQNYGDRYYSFMPTSFVSRFPIKRFSDDGNSVYFIWGYGQRRTNIDGANNNNAEVLPYMVGIYNPYYNTVRPVIVSNFTQSTYPTSSYTIYGFIIPLGVFEVNGKYKHIGLRVSSTESNDYPAITIYSVTEDGSSVSYNIDIYEAKDNTAGAVPIYYDATNAKLHILYPRTGYIRAVVVNLSDDSTSYKDLAPATNANFLTPFVDTGIEKTYYGAYVSNTTGALVLSKFVYDDINIALTETVIDNGLPEVASALQSKTTTVIRLEKVPVGTDTYYLLFLEGRLTNQTSNLSDTNSSGDNIAKIWIYKENAGTLEKVGELQLPTVVRCVAFSKDRQTAVVGTAVGTFLLVPDANSSVGFSLKTLSSVIPVAIGRDEYDRFWIMDIAGELYLYSPVLPFEVDARLELPTHYIKEGETIQGTLYVKVVDGNGNLMVADVRLVSRNPDVALLGTEASQTVDITTSTDGEVQVPVTVYRRGKIIIDRYLLSVTLGG